MAVRSRVTASVTSTITLSSIFVEFFNVTTLDDSLLLHGLSTIESMSSP